MAETDSHICGKNIEVHVHTQHSRNLQLLSALLLLILTSAPSLSLLSDSLSLIPPFFFYPFPSSLLPPPSFPPSPFLPLLPPPLLPFPSPPPLLLLFSLSLLSTSLPAAFHGWVDRAYPPQPTSDKIELQLTNGSSAILECHPNTTEPVVPWPSWLRNNTYLDLTSTKNHYLLPDGSLLVRNLSFPPGSEEWQYKCILSLPTERTRDFVLSLNQGTS